TPVGRGGADPPGPRERPHRLDQRPARARLGGGAATRRRGVGRMTRQVRSTVARHRYIRGVPGLKGKLWDALHYMQCRPLGEDEQAADRILFTARTEGLSRQEARTLILEHAGRRVAYHRLILSPGESVADTRRWTRLVLADLSRHL